MKSIGKKVTWLALTVVGFFLTVSLTTLFAYALITNGCSEFLCGMMVVPCMIGYIALADSFREWIMNKAFKNKDTQVNI